MIAGGGCTDGTQCDATDRPRLQWAVDRSIARQTRDDYQRRFVWLNWRKKNHNHRDTESRQFKDSTTCRCHLMSHSRKLLHGVWISRYRASFVPCTLRCSTLTVGRCGFARHAHHTIAESRHCRSRRKEGVRVERGCMHAAVGHTTPLMCVGRLVRIPSTRFHRVPSPSPS
jgi:hypothetical protein